MENPFFYEIFNQFFPCLLFQPEHQMIFVITAINISAFKRKIENKEKGLFYGDGFRQVSRSIRIISFFNSHVISQKL